MKSIKTEIANMSLQELYNLNKMVVDRISAVRSENIRNFKIGDIVKFKDLTGEEHTARITRRNKKTVTVEELIDGMRTMTWRVGPSRIY